MLFWLKTLFNGSPAPSKARTSNAHKIRLLDANGIKYIIDGQNKIWIPGSCGQWRPCPEDMVNFEFADQD